MSSMLQPLTNIGKSRQQKLFAAIRTSRSSKRKCLICEKHRQPLFRFPKDDAISSSWKKFCNIKADDVPKKRRFLCCIHFTTKSIILSPFGRVRVKPNAIPTLCGPKSVVRKKPSQKKSKSLCYMCGQLEVGTSCFKFPKDSRLPTWLAFCGVQLTKPTARLCVAHFTPEDVTKERHRCVLKSTAVPVWHVPKSKAQNSKFPKSKASVLAKRKRKTNQSSGTSMNTSASDPANLDKVLDNKCASESDVHEGTEKHSQRRLTLELSVRGRFAAFTRESLEKSVKAIPNESCDTHAANHANIEQITGTAKSPPSASTGTHDDEAVGTSPTSDPLSRVSLPRHRHAEEIYQELQSCADYLPRPDLNTPQNREELLKIWVKFFGTKWKIDPAVLHSPENIVLSL